MSFITLWFKSLCFFLPFANRKKRAAIFLLTIGLNAIWREEICSSLPSLLSLALFSSLSLFSWPSKKNILFGWSLSKRWIKVHFCFSLSYQSAMLVRFSGRSRKNWTPEKFLRIPLQRCLIYPQISLLSKRMQRFKFKVWTRLISFNELHSLLFQII